jgi:hypothetical protein
MKETELENLRYPIGRYEAPGTITDHDLAKSISEIAAFPERIKAAVSNRTESQLDTPYRPDGWTVRQVVHHCADSHMNCYIRFKWALTEDSPTIKYYFEDRWSNSHDNRTMPIEPTLRLLEGLHERLVYLISSLNTDELERNFVHPEHQKTFRLREIVGLYAWHGNHHLAHITSLAERKGW